MQNKIFSRLRSIYLNRFGSIVRKLHSPTLPTGNKPVWVHIGCGEINDSRFVNVDARPFPHVHKVTTSLTLEDFPDESIELIYACHVVEHVSFLKVDDLFRKWLRKLKKGGIARISVPDFDQIVEIYKSESNNIDSILPALMGGQDYPFNFHYAAFNKLSLSKNFQSAGFSKVEEWSPEQNSETKFDDWAGKCLELGAKRYPISLNLQGIK